MSHEAWVPLSLSRWPTPIERLDRLSDHLGGPRIYVKRDDTATLGLGGNKVRKLEFLLGRAVADRIDTVVTTGALQSNHARLTAAACARLGLTCILLLQDAVPVDTAPYRRSGNRLLDDLFGAEARLVGRYEPMAGALADAEAELRASGANALMIPLGGSNAVGTLGYARCAEEIRLYERETGLRFDEIVVATGSGGTQAGLVLGRRLHGLKAGIVGVSVNRPSSELSPIVAHLAGAAADLLGREFDGMADDVMVDDRHYAPGYGLPNDACREAISLCARLEGLVLDPVYSGKAMAALIAAIRGGAYGSAGSVLFIHTGGVPALFAYTEFTDRQPASPASA
ncbi:MAG: pyridoxal-5-phosphate-dependent protein [Enterovirga sp.]|nr:pyridoxal-5-phosphate-dependent protein [Enterovirga sp.]